ncbi:hypothetical protein J5N97_024830 [Dioscorea zingiberensis]|uniref:Uncharacterized protein n=1 Tax=Dioscorea zingiberensis TaxID=325984 RepID=A0A9D5C7V3_9LILI|nr:hypothetical protein J5N97_024830 [Dioscorea zingiberensis]
MRYPETLHQSMQNSVLNLSTDHFLPILSVASCELVGGEHASIIPTACAIKIAHAASLLHDEQLLSHSSIPYQRMAVLTGEALFIRAFECVVSFTPPGLVPEFIIQQVVTELSKAVGSTGVAGRQSLISCEKEIIWMLRRKFGAMAECSAVCGGLVGGGGEDVVGRLRKYGMAVGVLHQVMGEILLMEDSEMDGNNNGVTLLGVVGIERAMELVEELKSKATRELDMLEEKYGEKAMPLRCILLDLRT